MSIEEAAPLLGKALGPYRIVRLLGQGGAGTVYVAEHEVIGRKVALKVLSGETALDEDAVSRFFTEARAVNQIRHPNIVAVTDFGTSDGTPYLVMELLDGETLGQRLDRARFLDPCTSIHIARQVASALGAAHERGMVHRDVKPANIFLGQHPDYPDFVKVLDFGIAKLMRQDEENSLRTQVGTLMGTPAYMSPEQCLADSTLDHRSDIYSLGVVVFLMVTGRLPFEEDQLGRLILAHVNRMPPDPSSLNREVSRDLSARILKALEKDPDKRHASMKEFRVALDTVVVGGPQALTPALGIPILMDMTGPPDDGAVTALARDTKSGPTLIHGRVGKSKVARGPVVLRPTSPIGASEAGTEANHEEIVFARLVNLVSDRLAAGKLELPEPPPGSDDCLDAANRADMNFGMLAKHVEKSTRLASQILRLVNSSAFPIRSPATSLEQAIARLGYLGLREAIIEFAVRPVVESHDPRIMASFRRPWPRALAVANLAERLAKELGETDLGHSMYLAGLVHEVGGPLVAKFLIAVENQTTGSHGARWMTDKVWRRVTDATFRSVSVAVARKWRLPAVSLQAIEDASAWAIGSGRSPGTLLRMALALAENNGFWLRRGDLDDVATRVADGRGHAALDEKTEQRVTHALKEHVALMSGIRGGVG